MNKNKKLDKFFIPTDIKIGLSLLSALFNRFETINIDKKIKFCIKRNLILN